MSRQELTHADGTSDRGRHHRNQSTAQKQELRLKKIKDQNHKKTLEGKKKNGRPNSLLKVNRAAAGGETEKRKNRREIRQEGSGTFGKRAWNAVVTPRDDRKGELHETSLAERNRNETSKGEKSQKKIPQPSKKLQREGRACCRGPWEEGWRWAEIAHGSKTITSN